MVIKPYTRSDRTCGFRFAQGACGKPAVAVAGGEFLCYEHAEYCVSVMQGQIECKRPMANGKLQPITTKQFLDWIRP